VDTFDDFHVVVLALLISLARPVYFLFFRKKSTCLRQSEQYAALVESE
jgi:hypothetical protein